MIGEPARRATLNKLVILKNHRYIKVEVVFLFWCYPGAFSGVFWSSLALAGAAVLCRYLCGTARRFHAGAGLLRGYKLGWY